MVVPQSPVPQVQFMHTLQLVQLQFPPHMEAQEQSQLLVQLPHMMVPPPQKVFAPHIMAHPQVPLHATHVHAHAAAQAAAQEAAQEAAHDMAQAAAQAGTAQEATEQLHAAQRHCPQSVMATV